MRHPISALLSRTVCQISRSIDQIIAFDSWYSSLMNSFSETYENIAVSHILLKTRFLGLHYCRRQCGPTSTTFM